MFPAAPFVLLEDARPGAASARLFRNPQEIIVARSSAEVEPALQKLRAGLKRGLHAAGWLSYDAGLVFEQRLLARAVRSEPHIYPLVWFGLFDAPARPTADEVACALPDAAGAWVSPPEPRIDFDAYRAAFERVKQY